VAERGIYVHIPFCLAKCAYCGFNSFPVSGGVPDYYVAALSRDVAAEAEGWRRAAPGPSAAFDTVYFGGGTPSLLSPDQLATILASLRAGFGIRTGAEISLECNPATAGPIELAAFHELGVSRLSVGVQSLAEGELKVLGRLHNADEALRALDHARRAGFTDVSADVMLGLPGQTRDTIRSTLDGVGRRAGHVSAYMLSVEDGTPMADMVSRGDLTPPGDDTLADQYEFADRVLGRLGFKRYEISNWSLPGRRCRHNGIYWGRGDYVGVGAGAHSHAGGVRWSKIIDPRRYAEALAEGGDWILTGWPRPTWWRRVAWPRRPPWRSGWSARAGLSRKAIISHFRPGALCSTRPFPPSSPLPFRRAGPNDVKACSGPADSNLKGRHGV
jgi:putative oxygen-independent coproporphyrinogen III oxidase